jgi:hypothetical protein
MNKRNEQTEERTMCAEDICRQKGRPGTGNKSHCQDEVLKFLRRSISGRGFSEGFEQFLKPRISGNERQASECGQYWSMP